MKSKSILPFVLFSLLLTSCNNVDDGWTNADVENKNLVLDIPENGTIIDNSSLTIKKEIELVSKLEEYTVNNNISGINLLQNVNFVKVSDKIIIPTSIKKDYKNNDIYLYDTPQHTYIPNYGFGIVSEGAKISISSSDIYDSYFKIMSENEIKNINYFANSDCNEYLRYITASLVDKRLAKDKSSYELYNSLAKEDIVALDLNKETNKATKYRVYVKDNLKYNTAGKFKDFVNKTIEIDDYLTVFKEIYTQNNSLYAGINLINSKIEIKGLKNYYKLSQDGYNNLAWNNVGIKIGKEESKSYIEFEFVNPISLLDAKLEVFSNPIYSPIPKSFLDEIGGIKNYGMFVSENDLTPVDTTLSVGPYMITNFDENKLIFSSNNLVSKEVIGGENRYLIEGVYVVIKNKNNKHIKPYELFVTGKIDCFENDSLKDIVEKEGIQIKPTSICSTRLNLNTASKDEWEYLFGENGKVTQTPKDEYWKVEPAMSNDSFIKALNYAINREDLANSRENSFPCYSTFTDLVCLDSEHGIPYNYSKEHQKVMNDYYGDAVDTYGYDLEKAKQMFKKASDELINQGHYKDGDVINLEMAWINEKSKNDYGNYIENYLLDAFNNSGSNLTLKIEHYLPSVWSDIFYKKMMVGQFDIGFGSISSSSGEPTYYSILETFKSNNSSGFTLNFGNDTNNINQSIDFENQIYTYDALLETLNGPCVIKDGIAGNHFDLGLLSNKKDEKSQDRTIILEYDGYLLENSWTVEIYFYSNTEEETLILLENELDYIVNRKEKKIVIKFDEQFVKEYPDNSSLLVFYKNPTLGEKDFEIPILFPKYNEEK